MCIRDSNWFDGVCDMNTDRTHNPFSLDGRHRYPDPVAPDLDEPHQLPGFQANLHDLCNISRQRLPTMFTHEQKLHTGPPDFDALRPYFLGTSVDVLERTHDATAQFYRTAAITSDRYVCDTYKSPCPTFNVHRRNEPVATDTVYSDTPAVDNGATSAHLFVGCTSLLADVYSMKSDKEFVNTLEDVIRK